MKRKKVGDYLSLVFYLFMAIWMLDFDNPNSLFASFICFLAFVGTLLSFSESDYCKRASRRLSRVTLILSLIFLIKVLFSI
jgi:hypothetical protein